MSIRFLRYTIWGFFEDLYYSVRTGDRWYEVKYSGWKVWHEATSPVRAFGNFFGRIWKYRDLLCHDADWDHSYLLSIMEFKFLNMMKYHRDYSHTLNGDKIALELAECAEICHRLQKDDYAAAEHAAHDAKWGESKMVTTPATEYGVDKLGKPKMFNMDITNPNATTPELQEQERQEHRVIWDLEKVRRQTDFDRLAELFRTRLDSWWD